MALSQFVRLVHSDWSINPNKRWAVEACRTEAGWSVEAPRRVGRPIEHFVTHLVRGNQPTLAGFDFPIGAPAIFGRMTEFSGFTEALEQFGVGSWSRFFHVAERPEDVSLHRPFYPYR